MPAELGYVVLAVVSVVSIWLGWRVAKRGVKFEGFAVAGRMLGPSLLAGSLIATWSNSYTIFVNSQFAFSFPFPNYVLLLFISLASPILVAIPVGMKALKVFRQGYSLPDLFNFRFGSSMHGYGAFVQVVTHFIYFYTQIMMAGVLLEAFLHVPAPVTMGIFTIVILAYTLAGGLWASVATDYLQILFAAIAAILIIPFAIWSQGGPNGIYAGILQHSPDKLQLQTDDLVKLLVSVFLVILSSALAQQVQWQRVFAARDPGALWKSFALQAAAVPGMAFIGAVPAFVVLAKGITLSAPDQAPVAFLSLVPLWIAVLYAGVVIMFIMSTADSMLLAVSTLVSADVYRKYVPAGRTASDDTLRRVAQVTMLVVGALGFGLAFFRFTMVEFFFVTGVMQATLIAPIFFALWSKRVTGAHAFIGVLAGFVAGSVAYVTMTDFEATVAAVFAPLIVTWLLSLTSGHKFAWEEGVSAPVR